MCIWSYILRLQKSSMETSLVIRVSHISWAQNNRRWFKPSTLLCLKSFSYVMEFRGQLFGVAPATFGWCHRASLQTRGDIWTWKRPIHARILLSFVHIRRCCSIDIIIVHVMIHLLEGTCICGWLEALLACTHQVALHPTIIFLRGSWIQLHIF